VPFNSGSIAESAFWHRRHLHPHSLRIDFIGAIPADGTFSTLSVRAGTLVVEQWDRLVEWDVWIARLGAAA
jgi:hypothetical protein